MFGINKKQKVIIPKIIPSTLNINNHEKNDNILPSIKIKNENKDKCININEEEENKEGNKSKRENKINKKALIDLDDYSTQNNLKSDKKISKSLFYEIFNCLFKKKNS